MPRTSRTPAPADLHQLTRTTNRRPKPALAVVAVLAVIALAGAGLLWTRANASTGPAFRAATATAQQVDETLSTVAVIEPVTQATVTFPIDGTVAAVDVAEGDTVAAGQTLARLTTDDLQDAVDEANASLANAQLTYRQALDGELPIGNAADGGTVDTSAQSEAAEVEATAPEATAPATTTASSASSDDNQQVQAAQAVVDDLATVAALLASATEACTGETTTPTGPGAPTGSSIPGLPTGDPPDDSVPDTESSDGNSACADALAQLSDALRTLETDLSDLATAISESAADTQATTPTTSEVPATDSGDATTSTVSDQQLVAYQKAVDAAEADVVAAEQALQQATTVSPIEGTVVDISIAPGDSVTAASADQAITIVSDNGYELTTDVDVTDLTDIEVGQPVTIVPDTDPTRTIAGEIVAIAVTPTADTTSYAVTIGVRGDSTGLRNGGLATTTITTASVDAEVAVPTSALSPQGAEHTVTVLDPDATTSTRTVTVGAIGPTWTEITAGLDAGETIVIADLDEPLPGSATDATNSSIEFPGGGGGFPGGGGGFGPPGG